MKEHNEIDALFESAFDGLTLTPDSSVKENIDQAIASKKKRRRFLFILFPVLFGTLGFAATIYFYSFSGKAIQEKTLTAQRQNENERENEENASVLHTYTEKAIDPDSDSFSLKDTTNPNQSVNADSKSKTNSKGKVRVGKNNFKTNRSSTTGKTTHSPGYKFASPETQTGSETEKSDLNRNNIQANNSPGNSENQTVSNQNTDATSDSEKDSTLAFKPTDLTDTVPKQVFSEPVLSTGKWSLAVLTYWEGEKKRTPDLQNEPFSNYKRETAAIHSSTFYGKIEVNYQFTHSWEMLTGIGFRSSKIIQYGSIDTLEIPLEDMGSGIPIAQPMTAIPDTIRFREAQSFRVNSVVIPLGFGYSFALGNNMRIRLAAGAEFAYGQWAKQSLNPVLSAPILRPFGCSVWLRPELYYSFGKMELFGFGSFNQTLSQQVRWNFETRRNPAFGGGIGLRIRL